MHLLRVKTQENVEAVIEQVTHEELKSIYKIKRFEFDWYEESANEVYKICLKESNVILGLMSLIDWPDELRIEIHLLELSKENVRTKNKEYDNIAGCLIAFACGLSFERNYFGFVSLIPKTRLRKYYIEKYQMQDAGQSVFLDTNNAAKLIEQYL